MVRANPGVTPGVTNDIRRLSRVRARAYAHTDAAAIAILADDPTHELRELRACTCVFARARTHLPHETQKRDANWPHQSEQTMPDAADGSTNVWLAKSPYGT